MSFLAPLYLLGALAILGPIVFHLIRRAPRGEVAFSSLMFLAPSPPQLTKRNRLDQWLLLLLRTSVLVLLAIAFMRPFLRETAILDLGSTEPRRIAVLIDVSASMRRDGLWAKAKAEAERAINDCRPDDQLALIAFDSSSQTLLGFEESSTMDSGRRQAAALGRLAGLSPGWGATNLGQALVDAVTAIEEAGDKASTSSRMERRIVLASDLQQGSRLDALGDFEWPSDVKLDWKSFDGANSSSNASAQWLAGSIEDELAGNAADSGALRTRVTNAPSSRHETFQLEWVGPDGKPTGEAVAVYAPPGESRVAIVPPPPQSSSGSASASGAMLRLTGDAQEFDNRLHLAADPKREQTVIYLGTDGADDPNGLLYYLQRVFDDSAKRAVRVISQPPEAPIAVPTTGSAPLLIVLAKGTTPETARRLKESAMSGGTVLAVADPSQSATLGVIADVAPVAIAEGSEKGDLLLGEIAFRHPLFSAFASAQFNDFTKIHFWRHRAIADDALGESQVVARFENGAPAILEKRIGKGRLIVMASGWVPTDSQLARSTKFVPLMAAMLEGSSRAESDAAIHFVHDRIALPEGASAVRKPDGSIVKLGERASAFVETDEPGVYAIEGADGSRLRRFAVNLDPSESKTDPLHLETLEQFGCRLHQPDRAAAEQSQRRQLQTLELEGRQKLWRWLILAAIGILIVETWLAGRLSRARARSETLAA